MNANVAKKRDENGTGRPSKELINQSGEHLENQCEWNNLETLCFHCQLSYI